MGRGEKPLEPQQRLALEGGAPVRTQPFAPWPHFAADEIAAVAAVLRSGKVNYWTGEQSQQFERDSPALSASNTRWPWPTARWRWSWRCMPWAWARRRSRGSAKTFIASASSVVRAGATPVVADIDQDSQNITAETIEKVLTPRTKAVVAVHLAGWPCEMDEISPWQRSAGCRSLRTARNLSARATRAATPALSAISAHSPSARTRSSPPAAKAACWSPIRALWERAWAYKDHGKSYAAVFEREHPFGFRWLHESFGSNWRITEIQSAIGRLQLAKLPQWLADRRRNAGLLSAGLSAFQGRASIRGRHRTSRRSTSTTLLSARSGAPGLATGAHPRGPDRQGIPCTGGACSETHLEKAFMNAGFGRRSRCRWHAA